MRGSHISHLSPTCWQGPSCAGIFPNLARVNHSCAPNSMHTWNAELGQETLVACRCVHACAADSPRV